MTEIALAILVLGGLGLAVAGYTVTLIVGEIRGNRRRIEQLEATSSRQRHTHSSIAGIEDATAVLIDLVMEADAMKARADTALYYLGKLREGPNAYPVDKDAD